MSDLSEDYAIGLVKADVPGIPLEDESGASFKVTSLGNSLQNISNKSDSVTPKKHILAKETSSSPLQPTKRSIERDFDPFFAKSPSPKPNPTTNILEFTLSPMSNNTHYVTPVVDKFFLSSSAVTKEGTMLDRRLIELYRRTVEEIENGSSGKIKELAGQIDMKDKKIHCLENDYAALEASFRNLHERFEKSRSYLMDCAKAQEAYQSTIESMKDQLNRSEKNYAKLKEKAEQKLDEANSALEEMSERHQSEIVGLLEGKRKSDMKYEYILSEFKSKESQLSEMRALYSKYID